MFAKTFQLMQSMQLKEDIFSTNFWSILITLYYIIYCVTGSYYIR